VEVAFDRYSGAFFPDQIFCLIAGLPDFFLVQHTTTGKMYQKGHKIYQTAK
jgi:hypothetical protein